MWLHWRDGQQGQRKRPSSPFRVHQCAHTLTHAAWLNNLSSSFIYFIYLLPLISPLPSRPSINLFLPLSLHLQTPPLFHSSINLLSPPLLQGASSPWNIGAAYRVPDSNINLSCTYQQGRASIQVLTPQLLTPATTHTVHPPNIRIPLFLHTRTQYLYWHTHAVHLLLSLRWTAFQTRAPQCSDPTVSTLARTHTQTEWRANQLMCLPSTISLHPFRFLPS